MVRGRGEGGSEAEGEGRKVGTKYGEGKDGKCCARFLSGREGDKASQREVKGPERVSPLPLSAPSFVID